MKSTFRKGSEKYLKPCAYKRSEHFSVTACFAERAGELLVCGEVKR